MTGRKRKIIWIATLVLLALALTAGGFFWLSQSSLLAVENIVVEGNIAVPADSIIETAGPYLKGQSLLGRVNQTAADAIEELPFIKTVDFDRRFPNTMCIKVREYMPSLNLAANGGIFLVSSDDVALLSQEQSQAGLPLLSTKEQCDVEPGNKIDCSDAAVGVQFVNDIPANFNYKFSEISVDDGRISARTTDGAKVNFGTLDQYELKFEVLRQLLARSAAPGEAVTVDVTVPERPVIREDNTNAEPADGGQSTTVEEDQPSADAAVGSTATPEAETEGAATPDTEAEASASPDTGAEGAAADDQ